MATRLFYGNYMKQYPLDSFFPGFTEPVVITASSELEGYPVSNVNDSLRRKRWSTEGGSLEEWSKYEFQEAFVPSVLIILDHQIGGTFGEIVTIEGNPTDDFSAPQFSAVVPTQASITNGMRRSIYYFDTADPNTYNKFWRIKYTLLIGDTTPRFTGKVYIGTYYDTFRNPDLEGIDFNQVDTSQVQRSLSDDTFGFVKNKFDRPSVNYKHAPIADMFQFQDLGKVMGTHSPFFIIIDNQLAFDISNFYYAKLTEPPKRMFTRQARGYPFFNLSLSFEEQIG